MSQECPLKNTETYVNGVYQPNPALQGCVNAKEAAYKVQTMNSQYNEMTNFNIIHWEKECAAGQTPHRLLLRFRLLEVLSVRVWMPKLRQ
jgi:hypothetical protein